MNLTAASAGYMSLLIMFLEILIRVAAIYTMFMIVKSLRVYNKRNS